MLRGQALAFGRIQETEIGLGLLALAASLPYVLTWFSGWAGTYDALTDRIMSAFLAGG